MRTQLTSKAEREAAGIFSKNLKSLLLAPPVRGKNILAIDPGFTHGCKLAALDHHGKVLETSVIYPFGQKLAVAEKKLQDIVQKTRCEIIGIGNGTACRETETLITKLIKRCFFRPLDVSYCIVNESGASVYSVTKEAAKELPGMDPNLRSAVSIGRRLQDPLLELVKIEPKHLGVGMYQHDVSEVLLKGAVEGVLEDCVSFVGVDLNKSTAAILTRMAGLGAKKAEAIIAWRDTNGPFINRKQLLLVKGLGKKSFEQCAGFVRVKSDSIDVSRLIDSKVITDVTAGERKRKAQSKATATTAKKRKIDSEYKPEVLDQTWIHPESYVMTYRLLEMTGIQTELIGTHCIKTQLDGAVKSKFSELTKALDTDEETLSLIIKGLQQPLGYDIRSEMERPSFKKELKSMDDLKCGQIVSGIVGNVTSFGVFVNLGVGKDGLIHNSSLGGCNALSPGDQCDCIIINLDLNRGRIGLKLMKQNKVELKLC